ncbi:hypothetical protein [Rhodopirellula sallentina]|uniref:Myosin heavy chain n=1 Tax=Rhodopirellula sallentina SM41 TaxID=1263870 RepID=M5UE38_9BACT|nr:hypothetical protein [Rhodopirellula sallentina]EMI56126.1 myosin heavy chain [Rhodopirellula sallentina SM41]
MITAAKPEPVSNRVRDRLDRLHGARQSNRVIHTLAWTLAALLLASAVALALDATFGWWSKPVRVFLSATVAALTVSVAAIGIRRLLSPRKDLELARVADSQTPSLEERLQTVLSTSSGIKLDRDGKRTGFDPVMFNLVASETDTLIDELKPKEAAKESSLRWPLLIAATGLVGWLLVTMQVGSDIRVLVARLVAPTADITRHELHNLPGDQVIASDEPWQIELTASGPPTDTVVLERVFDAEPQTTANGDSLQSEKDTLPVHESVTLSPKRGSENQFRFRQRRLSRSFRYRLAAGDLRTRWYDVTVADRPRISSVSLTVTPPSYAQLSATTHSRLPNRLTVIEGSTVEITVTGFGQIDQAMLLIEGQSPRTMWSDNGKTFSVSVAADSEMTLSPQLIEPHGLVNRRSPSCRVLTRRDLPPTVRIKTPRPDQKVRPDDKVTLTFQATDDVGLAKAQLVIESESEDATVKTLDIIELPVPMKDGEPIQKWNGKTEIDLSQYGLSEGQTLRYRIEAYDTKQSAIVEASAQSDSEDTPQTQTSSAASESQPRDSILSNDQATEESAADASQSNESASENNKQTSPSMSDTPSSSSADTSESETAETQSTADNRSQPESTDSTSQTPQPNVAQASDETQESDDSKDQTSDQTNQTISAMSAADAQQTDSAAPVNDMPPSGQQASSQQSDKDATKDDTSEKASATTSSNDENPPSSQAQEDAASADKPNSTTTAGSSQNSPSDQQSSAPGAQRSPPADSSDDDEQQSPDENLSTPPDGMTRRGLDVPQPGSSQQMRLQITETIGSFEGTARRKTEIAVAATIHRVEDELDNARQRLSKVLKTQTQTNAWNDELQVDVNQAHSHLLSAIDAVKSLLSRTKGTPYAFIGVQLAEITHTHIRPAEEDAGSVVNVSGDTRTALVMASRQQTIRAIERLRELYKTFEKAKKDFEKADNIEQIQKMYRVYLEDSLAELSKATKDDPEGLRRTMAELDVDEDYLERLQEVLKMQNELRAELARLLADDPRLMRRYFQNFGEKGQSIRSQLFALADQQSTLHQQLTQYADSESEETLERLLLQHAQELATESLDLVQRAFEIEETFETWLPLRDSESSTVSITRDAFLESTSTAAMITSHYEIAPGSTLLIGDATWPMAQDALTRVSTSMTKLIESLDQVAAQLGVLAQSDEQYASNALRRIVELSEMRDDASRWNRKAAFLSRKEFSPAIGVDQSTIAVETHVLTDKLTGLQAELAGLLDGETGMLPQSIADRCNVLLAKLDRDVEPVQLAAIRALQQSTIAKATVRTQMAAESLDDARELLDAVLSEVIEQLDKLPPDPLADLLDDPTLDEILAILEQERDFAELLGIPSRPTNLQIVNDWANGGKGPGGAGRARLIAMIRAAMNAEGKKSKKALDRAKQLLMNAGVPRTNEMDDVDRRTGGAFGWNIVRSRLSSGLLQGSDGLPPEAYRKSIDRYFELISGSIESPTPDSSPP